MYASVWKMPGDALCGLAGAVRVLLAGWSSELGDHDEAITAGLRVLVTLTSPQEGTVDPDRPAWWIPPNVQRRCPRGGADPGLAHGISGPLVTLAAALRYGIGIDGLAGSVTHVCRWLISTQQSDLRWPHTVPLDGQPAEPGGRTAWCYGAGGTARALYLAATALNDQTLTDRAIDTLVQVAADVETCRLSGPTICHGLAGLLHVVARTAHDSKDPRLAAVSDQLAGRVAAAFVESTPFGFQHLQDAPGGRDRYADIPGLLTGAAGVAAVLLSWAQPDVAPVWDLTLMTG